MGVVCCRKRSVKMPPVPPRPPKKRGEKLALAICMHVSRFEKKAKQSKASKAKQGLNRNG